MTSSSYSSPAGVEPRPDESGAVLRIDNLKIEALDKRGNTTIVKDLSLSIRSGETLCVVGESGSGKSVSSLAVMGLLAKSVLSASGEIRLEGENVLTASEARLRELRATRMAMVFQEPMTALNPVERVGKQIEEVLKTHSRHSSRERKQQVLDMMRAVRLPNPEQLYNAYPHQLSGGQRQRIVICMALILKPKLLIADEPTTALDVTTQKQILTLIKELQQTLRTAVLFITHDFGVVSEIADRIVVMNKGEIVETGTRDEILARPRQAYTRMLVSSVPSLVPKETNRALGAPVLEVTGVDKTYKQARLFGAGFHVNAVQDAKLSLRRGEIIGIVGESGSGKSTLARCIARLIDPTAGRVELGGRDIATLSRSELRPFRKCIQVVFQDPYKSLNARLRVGDSIIEGLLNFGMKRAEAYEKAEAMIELVGMHRDVLRRYPHQFSGGQRQRICIARALALEPEVLIADEAVSALDVSVQKQVLDLIEKIRVEKNISILFITHDLRVAAQICDTIIVMQKGRIVEASSARQVLTTPQEDYTRLLISTAPGRDWDFRNFRPLTPSGEALLTGQA